MVRLHIHLQYYPHHIMPIKEYPVLMGIKERRIYYLIEAFAVQSDMSAKILPSSSGTSSSSSSSSSYTKTDTTLVFIHILQYVILGVCVKNYLSGILA